ncbi:MAG TPA: hypothetical protein DDZ80_03480 [Cyanobacteria bacterium UBA8803]|nr:hypothetical protein [Cyanobacteria bacterium UBA9273]HBL57632.1 hypothetical protein [Cyanobacteria bacterium UBA8803]
MLLYASARAIGNRKEAIALITIVQVCQQLMASGVPLGKAFGDRLITKFLIKSIPVGASHYFRCSSINKNLALTRPD